jgi:protein-S-isoprenylcysteine O-methyltransferase Ste14
MRRLRAVLGSAVFLVLAPGTVAGLVPWWISRWRIESPFFGFVPVRAAGVALIAAAVPVLLESFGRFALQGLGTPAPVLPTRHLVVKGFYRWVRNPMYLAVQALILGQALLFGSAGLLLYGFCAGLVMHLFVVAYEEPTLRRSFGHEYEAYCAHVPRWLPRLRPWRAGGAAPTGASRSGAAVVTSKRD